jgi:hypothetical protein
MALLIADVAAGINIRSYYSPRNGQRPHRKTTRYIVLHTTEGPSSGSLIKLRANGETNYFVDRDGKVLRIIERSRVAYHAGRSMWDGRTNLDDISVGIEVVGYHNKEPTWSQIRALKELLAELQRIYKIPDERVLTHSMVAYGAPNQWHRRSHRGRKRCAMVFASHTLRSKIGLESKPLSDPDVRARRLVIADPDLALALYSNAGKPRSNPRKQVPLTDASIISARRSAWDIARERYNDASTKYVFPDGTTRAGNRITKWKSIPPGTRVVIGDVARENASEHVHELGRDGASARDIAGEEHDASRTIYFLPDGRVRTGSDMSKQDLGSLPGQTKILMGYVHGGYITAQRSAFDVCGVKWNHPSTYYRYADGSLKSGDDVNENHIPRGTQVFFRN